MGINTDLYEFFRTVYNMRETDHIDIPCKSGGTIKLQKDCFPKLKAFYFEDGNKTPSMVSETDFETMKQGIFARVQNWKD